MKLRDRLIALLCILLFAGLGFVFFKQWVVQRPFAVILFVTDNLDPRAVAAARLYGGREPSLVMEQLPVSGTLRIEAVDSPVPDSAAAAALLSGGQPTGWNATPSADVPLLVTQAAGAGRSVGLVTNGPISRSAPAAFITQGVPADDGPAVAAALIGERRFDVIFGGGRRDFLPKLKGGSREDARDLLLEARQAGYKSAQNFEELEAIPTWQPPRVLGLFADDTMAGRDEMGPAAYQPPLAVMVRKAVQLLEYNHQGYFLIVDAGLVRKAALSQNPAALLEELLAFDDAIQMARQYSGERTVLAVAGLAGIGGLALNGKPFPGEQGRALLGNNRSDLPFLQWNTDPRSPFLAGDPLFFVQPWQRSLTPGHAHGAAFHDWLASQF